MTKTAYRGVVRGGMVVLESETPLRDGTEVVVTPVGGDRGSPAAVLAALDASPRVPAAWVHELEHLIAENRETWED